MIGFAILALFVVVGLGSAAGHLALVVGINQSLGRKREAFRQAMAGLPAYVVPEVRYRRVVPMAAQWGRGELHVLPFGFFLVTPRRHIAAYVVRAEAEATTPVFPGLVAREVPLASERDGDAFTLHLPRSVTMRLRGLPDEAIERLSALFPPLHAGGQAAAGFVPRQLVGLEAGVFLLSYATGLVRAFVSRGLSFLWFVPFWLGVGLILLTTAPPALRPRERLVAALVGLLPLCVVMMLSTDLTFAASPLGLFVMTFVYLAARFASAGKRWLALIPAALALGFALLGVTLSVYAESPSLVPDARVLR